MSLKSLLCLCALVASVATAPAQNSSATRLRVLSYNIHHGEGTDGQIDLERIARLIRDAKPDLVALQEVDQGVRRTRQADQPQRLSQLTGMEVVFGGNIFLEGGLYGNAVLTRLPILRSENHKLPVVSNGEQRGALEVELSLSDDESLLLFATHLDHRPGNEERLASAHKINRLIREQAHTPALLMGDLNDVPESITLTTLGGWWQRTNRCVLLTFPAPGPQQQIDYVMIRPRHRWCVIETQVLNESRRSDHRPVLTELLLRHQ